MAIASASTFVRATKSTAWSGSVSSWSCDSLPSAPWPSSASPCAGFQRAQHAELAFDRCADPVRDLGDATGDVDVVFIVGGRLGVALQRAIHHHRGEAVLDRA